MCAAMSELSLDGSRSRDETEIRTLVPRTSEPIRGHLWTCLANESRLVWRLQLSVLTVTKLMT